MKILLINPSIKIGLTFGLDDGLPKGLMDYLGGYQPLGVLYIAGVLIKNGFYDVSVIDAQAENLTPEKVVRKAKYIKPDIIGISCITFSYLYVLTLARMLKKETHAPLVIGGTHVDFYPEEIISHTSFDIGVIGEGEYTFLKIIELFNSGNLQKSINCLADVPGVVFKYKGATFVNPPNLIKNIDEIPFPARELLPLKNYYQNYLPNPCSSILTVRGCPYKCSFCSHTKWYRNVRFHSPEYVVTEIKHCIDKYNTRSVQFFDDCFLLNKTRVLRICELIKKMNIKIKFVFLSRVDSLDEELAKSLKEAGCSCISFGIESADPEIQNKMSKGTTVEHAKKSIRLCKKYGIESAAYFIIGFPDETYKSINNTIKFIKETNPNWFKSNILIPYPGTEIYNDLLRKNSTADFWKEMTITGIPPQVPNSCNNLARNTLEKFRNRINLMPYFRKKTNLINFKRLLKPKNVIWSIRWLMQSVYNFLMN